MFYDHLKSVCEEAGVKMTPIVKECGGATGSIGAWKKGAFPSSDLVVKLAMRLNVSTDRLLLGCDTMYQVPKKDGFSNLMDNLSEEGMAVVRVVADYVNKYKSLPVPADALTGLASSVSHPADTNGSDVQDIAVYDLPASAGTGLFLDSDDYTLMTFPVTAVPRQANFGVKIRGDSMTPRYSDGDIVFIKRQKALNSSEIGVFCLNGDSYCKQYIEKNGSAWLKSLNPDYPPIPIGEYDEVRVVGKVIGSVSP